MALKTSADWRVEIEELRVTNQALLNVAEEEGREFNDDERDTFEANMTKLADCQKGLESAERLEAQKREIAALSVASQNPVNPIGGLSKGRGAADRANVQHRLGPLRAFKGADGPRDAYDSGMYMRAIIARFNHRVDEEAEARIATRGWSISNVATEGSPTGGGYLVPAPMSNAIIDVRALAGVSRNVCRIMPMTSDKLDVPRKTAGTTVYYPGEGGSITASDQTWGSVELNVKKRAILSKISQELRDDALIGIVDDLVSQMGLDFAIKEDAELVNGDGTSTYGGERGLLNLLGSAGVFTPGTGVGKSVWTGLAAVDFAQTMAKLPSRYQVRNPAWLVSSEFYFGVMWNVMAAAGGNNVANIEGGPSSMPVFMGRRVYLTDQMPRTTATSQVSALYGSFSDAAMIGDRGGVSIAQSEHLNFAEEVLAVRATVRYDINVHDSGDSSNAGAYVGLSTAAS